MPYTTYVIGLMDNDGPSVACQAGSIAVEATIISPDVLLSAIIREAGTVLESRAWKSWTPSANVRNGRSKFDAA